MSRAVLTLSLQSDRHRAKHWIDQAPLGTRVEFQGPRRSLEANAKMWAMLTEIACQVEWYGSKLTPEDWKDVFSASLRKARVVPGLDTGTFVPLGMRTSQMTKAEMSDLIELITCFAAERGVVFQSDKDIAA